MQSTSSYKLPFINDYLLEQKYSHANSVKPKYCQCDNSPDVVVITGGL